MWRTSLVHALSYPSFYSFPEQLASCSGCSKDLKQKRSLPGLSQRRNNTELLQHPERIKVEPLFDGLVVCDTGNQDVCHRNLFACGRNAHKIALVGAPSRVA